MALLRHQEQRPPPVNTYADTLRRPSIFDTAQMNTWNFSSLFRGRQVQDVLRERDTYLTVHSTDVLEAEMDTFIDTSFDIDGVVVQTDSFAACRLPYRRLHLDVRRNSVPAYHLVKKHLDLSRHSDMSLTCLKQCRALVVFRHAGYNAALVLLPQPLLASEPVSRELKRRPCYDAYFAVFKRHAETILMQSTRPADMSRPTLRKNQLSDLSFWDVLPQDAAFMLDVLDKAMTSSAHLVPRGSLPVVLAAYQFGQKQSDALQLADIVDQDRITRISIHSALNLSLNVGADMHFMWSRSGLEDLNGRRPPGGKMFPLVTLAEAANFQSSLCRGRRLLHVAPSLTEVSAFPADRITFLQMYADIPHRHLPPGCRPHPVSGIIVTSGVLHHNAAARLSSDADSYLLTIEDNTAKMRGALSKGRFEVVTAFDSAHEMLSKLPGDALQEASVTAQDTLRVDKMMDLLRQHPLLVPFTEVLTGPPLAMLDNIDDNDDDAFVIEFSTLLASVPQHLCDRLRHLNAQNRNRGGFLPSWSAFQLELAVEKFFWGRPIAVADRIYSVNLGPGSSSTSDRSVTCARGFMCLENASSCAADQTSPPPLRTWITSESEQRRVRRIFDFSDTLDAAPHIIGEALLVCLVLDLAHQQDAVLRRIQLSTAEIFAGLRTHGPPPRWAQLVGGQLIADIAQRLSTLVGRLRYPAVTQRAAALLRQHNRQGVDLQAVIAAGLRHSRYQFFPNLVAFDEARNDRVRWKGSLEIVQVMGTGTDLSVHALAAEWSRRVIPELERRGLCYATTLRPIAQARTLPWMVPLAERISAEQLITGVGGGARDHPDVFLVVTYITAIALMQTGFYVDYNKMAHLDHEVRHLKARLKQLNVLSMFRFPLFNKANLYRLHQSIPHKIPGATLEQQQQQQQQNQQKHQKQQRQPQHEQQPDEQDEDALVESHDAELDDVDETQTDDGDGGAGGDGRPPHCIPATSSTYWTGAEIDVLRALPILKTWQERYSAYVRDCCRGCIPCRNYSAFRARYARFQRQTPSVASAQQSASAPAATPAAPVAKQAAAETED